MPAVSVIIPVYNPGQFFEKCLDSVCGQTLTDIEIICVDDGSTDGSLEALKNRASIRGRMNRKQPLVSIIMPVHNSANYLERTLESILSQSFRNFELIAVNDGSTDSSLEKMTYYAQWDIRMKIIDLPENKGVSSARNAGLDAATGEYVFFIDSDDWLEGDHIESMVRRMEESGADIETNVSYACEYPEQGKRTLSNFEWAPEKGGWVDSVMVQRLFSPVVWASLYRRSYLNDNRIRFIEIKGGAEDIHFSGLSYLCTDKVYVFRGPALHYLQRAGSLMHGKKNGFFYLESFKALHDGLAARGRSTEGMKLFFVESLFIETEEQFTFVKDFVSEDLSEEEKSKCVAKAEPFYGLFTGAILMRRSVFETIGPLPENVHTGEIIYWQSKMDENHFTVKKIDLISTDRRIHTANFGQTNRRNEFKDYAAILRMRMKKG